MFNQGCRLKFSKEGLNLWLSGRRGFYEPKRYESWRWHVLGYRFDMLILERIDIMSHTKGVWSPKLFETVRD